MSLKKDEIAAVIGFLTSAGASFVNGAIIPVDGGQHLVPSSRDVMFN